MEDTIKDRIEEIKDFLLSSKQDILLETKRSGGKSITFDFFDFQSLGFDFLEHILDNPNDALEEIKQAIKEVINSELKPRIQNLPKDSQCMIKDIRTKHIGKLIEIEGVIRQTSTVKPQITSVKYECPSCSNELLILQEGGKLREPVRCGCGRKGKFRIITKKMIDTQRMVVEELPERLTGKENPQQTNLILKDDLTNPKLASYCTPGTQVKIVGIVVEFPIVLKSGAVSVNVDTLIDVLSIRPEDEEEIIKITEEDKNIINEEIKSPDYFKRLLASIAPEIYGMDLLKTALLYHIVGGNKIRRGQKYRIGDINILAVTDPAIAKSTSMDSLMEIAPKVIYTDCTGLSGPGLSAAAVKDEFIGGYALQAGAAVLASGGSLILDELDKIDPMNRNVLHVIMSEQKVVKHVANLHVTMKAECGIIGLCNPKKGRFDINIDFAQQIDMPPSLISRFDIPILLTDLPDEEKDSNIAEAILDFREKDAESAIPVHIMKKLFIMAREYKPTLSPKAKNIIKDYYIKLRKRYNIDNKLMITPRQFETLVKITEANAKLRFSNTCTMADGKMAINFFDKCMETAGVYAEGIGVIDEEGIGKTRKDKIKTVLAVIKDLKGKIGNNIPVDDITSEAQEHGVSVVDIEEVLERLKKEGEIFEPRRGFIGLL